jgi:hypothetical protein
VPFGPLTFPRENCPFYYTALIKWNYKHNSILTWPAGLAPNSKLFSFFIKGDEGKIRDSCVEVLLSFIPFSTLDLLTQISAIQIKPYFLPLSGSTFPTLSLSLFFSQQLLP